MILLAHQRQKDLKWTRTRKGWKNRRRWRMALARSVGARDRRRVVGFSAISGAVRAHAASERDTLHPRLLHSLLPLSPEGQTLYEVHKQINVCVSSNLSCEVEHGSKICSNTNHYKWMSHKNVPEVVSTFSQSCMLFSCFPPSSHAM